MGKITSKIILFFFFKNLLLSLIYLYGMVAIYFSTINIEGLLIGFYQMAFTIGYYAQSLPPIRYKVYHP